MKIGILTQPLWDNYGGLLQNYALQQVLMSMGHQPVTIDHGSRKKTLVHRFCSKSKRFLWQHLCHHADEPMYEPTREELDVIEHHFRKFINKHIIHTEKFTSRRQLKGLIHTGKYEAYIVGSDQCWRPAYSGGFLPEMFLCFLGDTDSSKRIAYAASFGTSEWEFNAKMTRCCAQLARKFDRITVREESGVKLCREHLGVDAYHVLDPTFLLPREHYEKLSMEEDIELPDKYLLCFFLDPTEGKRTLANNIADTTGLQTFSILPLYQRETRTKEDVKCRMKDCVYRPVAAWLKSFAEAEMVVADSFHAAVFAIIFNKHFWIVSNADRGNARFDSLLKMFGLSDRIISETELRRKNWQLPIEWKGVNDVLEQRRRQSIDLLYNSLIN